MRTPKELRQYFNSNPQFVRRLIECNIVEVEKMIEDIKLHPGACISVIDRKQYMKDYWLKNGQRIKEQRIINNLTI